MIIRKPYAFLIKNFKLINFIILIFSSYVLYKSNRVFNFFKNYVDSRQVLSVENISNSYLPATIFIFSILIVVLSTIIFVLLKEKDKPKLLYILMILYYILFIVFAFFSKATINTIILEGISPKNSRIIRDISLIMFIIQIIFVIFTLIRTLGFDIKKFHFGEDLQALQIDVSDNEEIELTTGIDIDKFVVKFKIQMEEWKSFFLENKIIIITIIILLVIIIPGSIVIKNKNNNKRYKENEIIDLNNFDFKVLNTYTTKYDYKGNKLLKGNSSYVIVKFNIFNSGSIKRGITLNNLRIEVNDKIYTPNTTYYLNFVDLGNGYYKQEIERESSKEYIAVYILEDKDITNNLTLRYTDSIKYNKNEIDVNYKRINIKPKTLDNLKEKDPTILNETINFEESLLKNTKMNISSYAIKENYIYDETKKNIVNPNGLVLKLSYEFIVDTSINYINNFNEFITTYAKINYTYNDKKYSMKINDITPSLYKNNDMFISVNEQIKDASNIKITFIIRNISYTYILK